MRHLSLCVLCVPCVLWASLDPSQPISIKPAEKHLDFLAGKDLIARYHFEETKAKPHFHPLNGPFGKPVTRGWPMIPDDPAEEKARDHPHQKAFWFCHGDVIPEGVTLKSRVKGVEGVDFWSEAPGHGTIVCVDVGNPEGDARHASVATCNEWRTAEGEKIMDETRVIALHDFGAAKLFVFDIDLHATVCNITFADTKEGAFGVRVAVSMTEPKGGLIENAEGKKTEKECWGRKSQWCDYSGPVDGKSVGIAILDHPKNPYPAMWHSRGYGLMAANPFGRGKSGFPDAKGRTDLVKLAKGDHLKFRYGLLVHPGNATEGKVAEHYEWFAKLP
jgi:hypothetical protein